MSSSSEAHVVLWLLTAHSHHCHLRYGWRAPHVLVALHILSKFLGFFHFFAPFHCCRCNRTTKLQCIFVHFPSLSTFSLFSWLFHTHGQDLFTPAHLEGLFKIHEYMYLHPDVHLLSFLYQKGPVKKIVSLVVSISIFKQRVNLTGITCVLRKRHQAPYFILTSKRVVS